MIHAPSPNDTVVSAGLLSRLAGAALGFATGGPAGAVGGFVGDPFGGGGPQLPAIPRIPGFRPPQEDPCPGGFQIPFTNRCVEGPIVPRQPVGGTLPVETGIFGALSTSPFAEQRSVLRCPPGLVLALDNRCYASNSIPRKYRKWKPARKPPVSAADARAIRRASSAQNRVKRLAQKSGFTCKRR